MKPLILLALTAAFVLAASPTWSGEVRPVYLLLDAETGQVIEAHWDGPDRPLPVGSLIKPFTALAYAGAHRFTYPTFVCRGTADGCWLPAGHGHIGMAEAVAGSCNAYFRQLAQQSSPDAFVSTLHWFGMPVDEARVTMAGMVGLGDGVKLAPTALMRAYLEIAARRTQPGVAAIVQGMRASARIGTGRAVGAAIGSIDALVKTGTAPCSHVRLANGSHDADGFVPSNGDGYTLVIYPADRPRVILLVQAHGRTGAETAVVAGELLMNDGHVR
jgi:cell division protein FtsI/penicillin-binding protein 2